MSNPSKFKDNDYPSDAENKAMSNWEDGYQAGLRAGKLNSNPDHPTPLQGESQLSKASGGGW